MRQIAVKIAAQIFCWTLWWWYTEPENLDNNKAPLSSKVNSQNNIILCENDCIISDAEEMAKVFNEYFAGIADGIGFGDPIPDDYTDDEVFSCYVSRYSNHLSVVAINSINSVHGTFSFSFVTSNEIYKLLMKAADHHEKSLYFHCSSTPCEK